VVEEQSEINEAYRWLHYAMGKLNYSRQNGWAIEYSDILELMSTYQPFDILVDGSPNEHGIFHRLYLKLRMFYHQTDIYLSYEKLIDYFSEEFEPDGTLRLYNNGNHPEMEAFVAWIRVGLRGWSNRHTKGSRELEEYMDKLHTIQLRYHSENQEFRLENFSNLSSQMFDALAQAEEDPEYVLNLMSFQEKACQRMMRKLKRRIYLFNEKLDLEGLKGSQGRPRLKNMIVKLIIALAVILILFGSGIEYGVINNWVIGVFLIVVAATLYTPFPQHVRSKKNKILLPMVVVFGCGILISLILTFVSDEAVIRRQIARNTANYVDVEVAIWERNYSHNFVSVWFFIDMVNSDEAEFPILVTELTAQAKLIFEEHDIENYRINIGVGTMNDWGGRNHVREWDTCSIYANQYENTWLYCPRYPRGALSGNILRHLYGIVGRHGRITLMPSEVDTLVERNVALDQLITTLFEGEIIAGILINQYTGWNENELEFQGLGIRAMPPEDIYHVNFEAYVIYFQTFVESVLNEYNFELDHLTIENLIRDAGDGDEYQLSWNWSHTSGDAILHLTIRTSGSGGQNERQHFNDISFSEMLEKIESIGIDDTN